MARFCEAEGIETHMTLQQFAEIQRVARELGVICHEDGRLELIRQ